MKQRNSKRPVLLLGGSTNALSVARSLGRRGVPVWMSMPEDQPEQHTRYCSARHPYPDRASACEHWSRLLLGEARKLAGCIVLACDDDALEFMAENHDALTRLYLLDDSIPEVQLAMLNKRRTLELAQAAGVPAPRFYDMCSFADLDRVLHEIEFPVIVKPQQSHLFQRLFGRGGRKYFLANDERQLRDSLQTAFAADLAVMVTEKIPGPDTLLGSYYTYIDRSGRALFHYTKKIIRRYPKNEGIASYHVSEWDDEIAEVGRRFFEGIGFRGFGNVEFKRDVRDGQLKIIECNPRFTAAQELVARAGVDAAHMMYCHLTGQPVPTVGSYRQGLRFWYPGRDFRAYRELRQLGELTFGGWCRSLLARQVFPYFRVTDPAPSVRQAVYSARKMARRARDQRDEMLHAAESASVSSGL